MITAHLRSLIAPLVPCALLGCGADAAPDPHVIGGAIQSLPSSLPRADLRASLPDDAPERVVSTGAIPPEAQRCYYILRT